MEVEGERPAGGVQHLFVIVPLAPTAYLCVPCPPDFLQDLCQDLVDDLAVIVDLLQLQCGNESHQQATHTPTQFIQLPVGGRGAELCV